MKKKQNPDYKKLGQAMLGQQAIAAAIAAKNEKDKSKRTFLVIIAVILGILSLWFIYREQLASPENTISPDGKTAQVHYIDVEQGDCSLLISDDGKAMLIDCGERKYSADVLSYLDNIGVKKLDYVIATHPHSDHIGGMADIISSDIEIGTFIMPIVADEFTPTTVTYEKMLVALSEKKCEVRVAKTENLPFGGGKIEIITTDYSGDNYNNYSPIVRFVFGERAFLFTGDAETEIESKILDAGCDVSADVYKAGHHGSSTSSSARWVEAVKPRCFVISCGAGNSYGHPHRETMALAKDYTDIILRTDLSGDIVFTTDGESLEYYTENE